MRSRKPFGDHWEEDILYYGYRPVGESVQISWKELLSLS